MQQIKKSGFIRTAFTPVLIRLVDWLSGGRESLDTDARIARCRAVLAGESVDPDLAIGRIALLFGRLRIVTDAAAQDLLIDEMTSPRTGLRVGFLNAHGVNLAWRDPQAARAFGGLDVLLRDGIGLKIVLDGLGRPAGLNMNGTDLIPRILAARRDKTLSIYGTTEPYLEQAAQTLRDAGMTVVETRHGFDPPESYAPRLLKTPAETVLLAMGMPRQEQVAQTLPVDGARVILCGGAIVDFLAGRHPRAPMWMRRANLEWLFRLSQEPVRLFDRYVIGNATFLLRTAFLPGRRLARLTVAALDWVQRDGREKKN